MISLTRVTTVRRVSSPPSRRPRISHETTKAIQYAMPYDSAREPTWKPPAREALNSGNVIAGPLAGPRLKFAQVLDMAGAGDKEKLVNTRTAIQGLATLTLESRAELKGQGQVTENEQKLLERARSGNIEDMTISELQQVVNISQRLAGRLWSNHQTLLKTMETDPAAADSLRYYRPTGELPKPVGESKPQAKADERKAGLDQIFRGKR